MQIRTVQLNGSGKVIEDVTLSAHCQSFVHLDILHFNRTRLTKQSNLVCKMSMDISVVTLPITLSCVFRSGQEV